MQTCDIPHDQWHSFLDDFSRRHAGECVTIEALEGKNGRHALASNVRLVGITDDPKNSEGEMIEVMAGDSPDSQTNHEVRSPRAVRVACGDDGREMAVEIESGSMPTTLVLFGGPDWAQSVYGPSTKPS
jgi:hypothetical protein